MIAIICAMQEERDALLKHMKNIKKKKGKKVLYRGELLDNAIYLGNIGKKEVLLTRGGVGPIYSTISTTQIIEKYKPELIINLGIAGSLNKKVKVGDVVIASKAAYWRIDVPEANWKKDFNNNIFSFDCDTRAINLLKKSKHKLHFGPIVSAYEFIYKKSQVKTIMKDFPEALCGEMEGASIANTCYAYNTKVAIVRGISDDTLVKDNHKVYEFELINACNKTAQICVDLIKVY